MEAKKRLAVEIMAPYHSAEEIERARQEWEAIHQKKASTGGLVVPEDTPTVTVGGDLLEDGKVPVVKLAIHCGFADSNSDARRLIKDNGIKLNGEAISDANSLLEIKSGDVLQRGKRKFARLKVQ